MDISPLAKKLKLKPHLRAALLHTPEGYLDELSPLPEGVEISTTLEGTFDWIQLFVKTKAEAVRPYKPGEARQSFR